MTKAKMAKTCFISLFASAALWISAANPMATKYNMTQCEGSLTPYPTEFKEAATPDTLTPVYLSHVGRHGARYPASSATANLMRRTLMHADSIGTITPLGQKLLKLTDRVIALSHNRWGALDSLGCAEQRGIATRTMARFPELFRDGHISALSSYSPRAMMSMYQFLHQMDRLNNRLEFATTTGRLNSPLMRPFDVDEDYILFRKDNIWEPAYDEYFNQTCPLTAINRVLGKDYPYGDTKNARNLAINEYYLLAGLSAMGLPNDMAEYLTTDEANALWSCFNLRQYLQRTATTVSTVPAQIASALVEDIIVKADAAFAGTNPAVADLRFGHAETIMPLVSLIRLPGCYYLTNYFDTVGQHWRDFDVVPMAANVMFVFFKAPSGKIYVCTYLNEQAVTLIPNDNRLYLPWTEARAYLQNFTLQ